MADEISAAKIRLASAFHEDDDDGELFEMHSESADLSVPELSEEEKYVV